jgi:hypothetical protein
MKLFHLYRTEDQSGVSGTGPVVEGVEFTNGWCALRWVTGTSTVCFYESLDVVRAIHGHGGKTELIVHDFEPLANRTDKGEGSRFELLLQIIEESSRAATLADEPGQEGGARQALEHVREYLDELESRLPDSKICSAV